MKRFLSIITLAGACCSGLWSCSNVNLAQASSAGVKAIQSMTISDAYVEEITHQYIQQLDAESTIAGPNDPYTVRLNRIVAPINNAGFNFKVYKTQDVNAFAVADGSIRVYSGLMDIMTDGEVLGVIGHEIGHVKNHDTRDAFRQALRASAVREGLASAGGVMGALSSSQMGAIGEVMSSAKYSRKQESEADEYGYKFLVSHGVNPWVLVMSFEKLQQMEQQSGPRSSGMQQLFSTHPDIANRINNMSKRAAKDGYQRPAASSGDAIYLKKSAVSQTGGTSSVGSAAKNTNTGKTPAKNVTTSDQWSF